MLLRITRKLLHIQSGLMKTEYFSIHHTDAIVQGEIKLFSSQSSANVFVCMNIRVHFLQNDYTHMYIFGKLAQAYCKKTEYSSSQEASPLRELTCHMRSHSVTCHPAEVIFPPSFCTQRMLFSTVNLSESVQKQQTANTSSNSASNSYQHSQCSMFIGPLSIQNTL